MAQDRVILHSYRIQNQTIREFLSEMVGTFILVVRAAIELLKYDNQTKFLIFNLVGL